MLTRLEVDGFKNLLGFHAEFGPFTCIAGPNGTGKSNVFDVIRFLSLLADHELVEAARLLRSDDDRSADPRELFWTDGVERASRMSLTAEMIVPAVVRDDFGREARASITFLRYELEIEYESPSGLATLGGLRLIREELKHINRSDAGKHLRFRHRANAFRRELVKGRRSGGAFISTSEEDGHRVIRVHQDGGSRGQPRSSPAATAPRTIVSTTTTSSDPTILAARREMQSWRMLALEPSAMRRPDRFLDPQRVASDGAHLAAALYRLAHTVARQKVAEADREAVAVKVYAGVAARLSRLVGVKALRVDRDDRYERLTLEVQERSGAWLPARSLSEGTLRFLALIVLDEDPEQTGLLCMEEPENGIHPARMDAMVELIGGMAVDPTREPGQDNPVRQVIVNTHSPTFVQLVHDRASPWREDVLLARTVTVRGPSGRPVSVLRLHPLAGTWRCDESEPGLGLGQMLPYLVTPAGGQTSIETLLSAEAPR